MLVDWIGIEFDIIQDKTFMLFSSNASNSVPHYITATSTSPPQVPNMHGKLFFNSPMSVRVVQQ